LWHTTPSKLETGLTNSNFAQTSYQKKGSYNCILMKAMVLSTMLATFKCNHWHENRDQEDGGENGRGRGEGLDVGGCRGSEEPE
jgi:hypothetical protein